MLYLSSFISAPTSPPSVSATGGNFQVGHRRKNSDGLFTETQVITGVSFPCTATLQPSIDPGKILDEVLVRLASDSVWRKVPQSLLVGSQVSLPASIPTTWDPVSTAQLSDSQGSQEIAGLDFGEFNSASEPTQTLYVLNNGLDTIESISVNLRGPGGTVLGVLNDRLEISLVGVKGKFGAGVVDTTYNRVHVYSSNNLNTIPVLIPVYGAAKLTLKLTNFPAYGLESTPIEADFDITPNASAVSVPALSSWPQDALQWDTQNAFQWLSEDPGSTKILLNPYRIRVGNRVFNSDLRIPITVPNGDSFLVISGNGVVTLEPQQDFVLPSGSLKIAKVSVDVPTGTLESYESLVPLNTPAHFLKPLGAIEDGKFVRISTGGLLEHGGTSGITGVSVGTQGLFVGLGAAMVKTSVAVVSGDKLGSNALGEAILDPEGSVTALSAGAIDSRILVWVGPKGGGGGSIQEPTNLGSSRTASQYTLTSSTGTSANLLAVTSTLAGLMIPGDKTKLDGIASGAQVNVPSNLSGTAGASNYVISNSNGTGVTIPLVGSLAGLMNPSDKTKLDGIASGAQVNVPTNLSGTPGASTILLSSSTGSSYTFPAATTSLAGLMTAADKVALNSSGVTNLSIFQGTTGLDLISSSGTDTQIPKAINLTGSQLGLVSKDDVTLWNSKQNAITTPGSGTQLISGSFMRSLVAGTGIGISQTGNDITLSASGFAPLASPSFTGTPLAPTPSNQELETNQIVTANWAQQKHAAAVIGYSGAAQSIAGSAWTTYTAAGTLTYAIGGFTMAAGGAGLVIPRTGLYMVNIRGLINVPPAQSIRILIGFVSGASGYVGYQTVLNANPASIGDTHFSATTVIPLGASEVIRAAAYGDVNATGPILLSVYSVSIVRL